VALVLMVFGVSIPFVFSRTLQVPSRPSMRSKVRLQVMDATIPC
jgi:hypothetical protein